jgi:hypothetical protein
MISSTYIVSGVLLFVSALLFKAGVLDATTQTIAWCVIFFFASAGASAAYLTVSEIFPMETRAMCIAFFYAIGTGVGGAAGPLIFGALVNTKHVTPMFWGFTLGAFLMAAAGVVAAFLAVDAEGKQLEEIATPVTAAEAEVVGADAAEAEPAAAAARPRTRRPAARLGRGSSQGWSPYASHSSGIPEELRDEVAAIEAALRENGPLDREDLKRAVNSRRWGPGCFAKALTEARSKGIVTRAGRNRFALAGDDGRTGSVPFVTGDRQQTRNR